MNHSDSERIAAHMEDNGLKSALEATEADLFIINTCGVRQMAEDRVYGQIHNLRQINPEIKIILTGCLANRKDVQRRMAGKVDLFIEIKDLPRLLEKLNLRTSKAYNRDYLEIIPKHQNNFQAYVPIMTGCNNFCAYCVVPYARGREVSRSHQEIIDEIKNLVSKGYKEIILLGQNINSYNDGTINFSKLLKKINVVPGKFWIYFTSSHPKDVNDEFIEAVAKSKKVCESIHLPVQSGSDKIIKAMNRHYTAADYLKTIRKIKATFEKYKKDIPYSITTDIIIGFPGETKKYFLETVALTEKAKYDMIYFGQYSPRPGTLAWKLKDSISKQEKAKREQYLNEILKKTALANNKKCLYRTLEVLTEKEAGGFYFGKTRAMKNVKFPADRKNLVGKFVKVKITKANIWNLEGKLS